MFQSEGALRVVRGRLVDGRASLGRRVLLLLVAREAVTFGVALASGWVTDGRDRGLKRGTSARRGLALTRFTAGTVLDNVALCHAGKPLLTGGLGSICSPALLGGRVAHVISASQSLRSALLLLALQARQIALLHVGKNAESSLGWDQAADHLLRHVLGARP